MEDVVTDTKHMLTPATGYESYTGLTDDSQTYSFCKGPVQTLSASLRMNVKIISSISSDTTGPEIQTSSLSPRTAMCDTLCAIIL